MPEKKSEFEKIQFDCKLALKEGRKADEVYSKSMSYGRWAKQLECLQWFI